MEKYKRALPLKYHIAAVFVGPLILFLNSIARMMAVNTVKIFLHSNVTSIGRVLASDVAYYETTFGYKNATPFGLRTKPSKETMVGRRGRMLYYDIYYFSLFCYRTNKFCLKQVLRIYRLSLILIIRTR